MERKRSQNAEIAVQVKTGSRLEVAAAFEAVCNTSRDGGIAATDIPREMMVLILRACFVYENKRGDETYRKIGSRFTCEFHYSFDELGIKKVASQNIGSLRGLPKENRLPN